MPSGGGTRRLGRPSSSPTDSAQNKHARVSNGGGVTTLGCSAHEGPFRGPWRRPPNPRLCEGDPLDGNILRQALPADQLLDHVPADRLALRHVPWRIFPAVIPFPVRSHCAEGRCVQAGRRKQRCRVQTTTGCECCGPLCARGEVSRGVRGYLAVGVRREDQEASGPSGFRDFVQLQLAPRTHLIRKRTNKADAMPPTGEQSSVISRRSGRERGARG